MTAGRNRCRMDRFARAAGVLRADDEGACRFNIALLADVLANLDQFALAVAAGTRFRFVAHFDALEVFGQRLAAGTDARFARGTLGALRGRIQFSLHGSQILVGIVLEQCPLFGSQRFALGAETQALEMGELEHQYLVLELERLNLLRLVGLPEKDEPKNQ